MGVCGSVLDVQTRMVRLDVKRLFFSSKVLNYIHCMMIFFANLSPKVTQIMYDLYDFVFALGASYDLSASFVCSDFYI